MDEIELRDQTRWVWLTRLALLIALGLAAVRCIHLETLRDPIAPALDIAGVAAASLPPESPGATIAIVLSWLGFVPMLLVLVRKSVDSTFRLSLQWWMLPAALLGTWAVASVAWSGDKFLALIGSLTFASGLSVLWAVSQCVRSWQGVRVVAGLIVGVLLIFVAQAFIYRFVEWPDLQETWQQQRLSFFQQRGWAVDSFEAQQFERNINNRALLGFFSSPNTYAAAAMLGAFVALGVVVQRLKDKDDAGWIGAHLVALGGAVALLIWSGSRTAMLGGAIGIGLLGIFMLAKRQNRLSNGGLWNATLAIGLAGVAGVVAVGISTGGLFHDSLTFRWRYWVGSLAMLIERPLLGTGWANFGQGYLVHRLPAASEEIKDPHNVLVRFAAELGVVGLLLGVAWLVMLSRSITLRPVAAQVSLTRPIPQWLFAACILVTLASIACAVDLNANQHYVFIELLKRLLFGGLLALGWMTTCLKSSAQMVFDDRPAPWLVLFATVGLGVFTLHSMVDMVMLETGPLLIFAVLAGAIVGLRSGATPADDTGPRLPFVAALTGGLVAWATVGVVWVMPVALAESDMKQAKVESNRRETQGAIRSMTAAINTVPVPNADYLAQLSSLQLALIKGGAPSSAVDDLGQTLDKMVAADVTRSQSYMERARISAMRQLPESTVVNDYNQAIALNPREIAPRLEIADYLGRTGDHAGAVEQLRAALAINAAYDPGESRRLSPEQLRMIEAAIQSLESRMR